MMLRSVRHAGVCAAAWHCMHCPCVTNVQPWLSAAIAVVIILGGAPSRIAPYALHSNKNGILAPQRPQMTGFVQ